MYECYDYENWDDKIKENYPGGVDVVIETISGPNTPKSLEVLGQTGHLCVIGINLIFFWIPGLI